jgi:hypothetical protein
VREVSKPEAEKKAAEAKTVTVSIINYGGKSVVWPPVAIVDGGDTIRFHAVNTNATVFIQTAFSFEGMEKDKELLDLPIRHVLDVKVKPNVKSDKASADLSAGGEDALGGVHPYSVYCAGGNDFAEGNSNPMILIEPPEDWPGRGGDG